MLKVPVVASNRINTPEIAEDILAKGDADLVSMARPLLADADFVNKAAAAKPESINTCIACNQACLDHAFSLERVSCLVNPRACHETELVYLRTQRKKRIAVVGAGMAGLSCATVAAERGHDVTLFEASSQIGGQFVMAAAVPGKEESRKTIRYFTHEIKRTGVKIELSHRATKEELDAGFDEIVIATGVKPRVPNIAGVTHPKVLTYAQVLQHRAPVGQKVAIIGAGGIGVDMCEFLLHEPDISLDAWLDEWGVDLTSSVAGGLREPEHRAPRRELWLLQRKPAGKRMGTGPGRTTGWVHKRVLERSNVHMMGDVEYVRIDDEGLHIRHEDAPHVLAVDNVILCAGQESVRDLFAADERGRPTDPRFHVIGGADVATELDAKRAIKQGAELAARL